MIPRSTVNDKLSTNIENSSKFEIKADAAMFELLSKKLYTNPVRAVIRELVSNAIDANIAAGANEQIIVHLPNALEDSFYVKDFGIGMDENELLSVFTYGGSLKRNSNDQIGGLGVGAKSPFSIVNCFTVESNKNGTKIFASCFIEKDGIPRFKILSKEKSNESGTKISFNVPEKYFDSFIDESNLIFLFSKEMPVLYNGKSKFLDSLLIKSTEEFDKLRFAFQKDGLKNADSLCKEYPDVYEYAFSNILNRFENIDFIVNMGGIPYTLEINQVFSGENVSALKKFFNIKRHDIFVLNFDIGTLDIQASRERLNYTENTIKVVKNKILNIIVEYFNTELKNASSSSLSLFDKRSLCNKFDGMAYFLDYEYPGNENVNDLIKKMETFIKETDNSYSEFLNGKYINVSFNKGDSESVKYFSYKYRNLYGVSYDYSKDSITYENVAFVKTNKLSIILDSSEKRYLSLKIKNAVFRILHTFSLNKEKTQVYVGTDEEIDKIIKILNLQKSYFTFKLEDYCKKIVKSKTDFLKEYKVSTHKGDQTFDEFMADKNSTFIITRANNLLYENEKFLIDEVPPVIFECIDYNWNDCRNIFNISTIGYIKYGDYKRILGNLKSSSKKLKAFREKGLMWHLKSFGLDFFKNLYKNTHVKQCVSVPTIISYNGAEILEFYENNKDKYNSVCKKSELKNIENFIKDINIYKECNCSNNREVNRFKRCIEIIIRYFFHSSCIDGIKDTDTIYFDKYDYLSYISTSIPNDILLDIIATKRELS